MKERIFVHIKSTVLGLTICAFAGYMVSLNFEVMDTTAWVALGVCASVGIVLIFGRYDKLIDVILDNLRRTKNGDKEEEQGQ